MDSEELLAAIDQSALLVEQQAAFRDWLKARSYMQINLWNALRRGNP